MLRRGPAHSDFRKVCENLIYRDNVILREARAWLTRPWWCSRARSMLRVHFQGQLSMSDNADMAERECSARIIQARMRGVLARQQLQHEASAALAIAQGMAELEIAQQSSARVIQARARGVLARRHLEHQAGASLELELQMTQQRNQEAAEQLAAARAEMLEAAARLQQGEDARMEGASMIQAHARGRLVRRQQLLLHDSQLLLQQEEEGEELLLVSRQSGARVIQARARGVLARQHHQLQHSSVEVQLNATQSRTGARRAQSSQDLAVEIRSSAGQPPAALMYAANIALHAFLTEKLDAVFADLQSRMSALDDCLSEQEQVRMSNTVKRLASQCTRTAVPSTRSPSSSCHRSVLLCSSQVVSRLEDSATSAVAAEASPSLLELGTRCRSMEEQARTRADRETATTVLTMVCKARAPLSFR